MSRAARGYLLVAGSFLIMGMIGALVDWASSAWSSPAGARSPARPAAPSGRASS